MKLQLKLQFISTYILAYCFLITIIVNAETNLKSPLFPEDGSRQIGKWFYTYNHINPEVLNAFATEGVTTVDVRYPYWYFQDLAAFDLDGRFIQQAELGTSPSINNDLTMGIYEPMGSFGEINRINNTSLYGLNLEFDQFEYSFFEGGGLITGQFESGEPYAILNYFRYDNLKKAARYKKNQLSDSEFHILLATDMRVKPENLIVIRDDRLQNQHLDLFIKALPNGVLLIDDPENALSVLNQLSPTSEKSNLEILKAKQYYSAETYKYKRTLYSEHIKATVESLKSKFKIIQVVGRIFNATDNLSVEDQINFFNGVSSVNKNNMAYFITNKANTIPELQTFWSETLKKFGFESEHIHFVGHYSDGAGLDCMGAPSP